LQVFQQVQGAVFTWAVLPLVWSGTTARTYTARYYRHSTSPSAALGEMSPWSQLKDVRYYRRFGRYYRQAIFGPVVPPMLFDIYRSRRWLPLEFDKGCSVLPPLWAVLPLGHLWPGTTAEIIRLLPLKRYLPLDVGEGCSVVPLPGHGTTALWWAGTTAGTRRYYRQIAPRQRCSGTTAGIQRYYRRANSRHNGWILGEAIKGPPLLPPQAARAALVDHHLLSHKFS